MGEVPLSKESFLEKYHISHEEMETVQTSWEELKEIYFHHTSHIKHLEVTAQDVSGRLRTLPDVHSLKFRIKDPEHLIAKIIRKCQQSDSPPITLLDYQQRITDLIGVRALHLFKGQWRPIHEFVTKTWELAETPIAYVRAGDSKELQDGFKAVCCDVKEHEFGYRSIHYLLKSQPTKTSHITELQVRTLFEEGWTEIDHTVRYPSHSRDPVLMQCLVLFNRFAGSADEMGSFIQLLVEASEARAVQLREKEQQLNAQRSDLEKAISQLQISKNQKNELEQRVEALNKASREKEFIVGSTGPIYNRLFETLSSSIQTAERITRCPKCGVLHLADTATGQDLCPPCLKGPC